MNRLPFSKISLMPLLLIAIAVVVYIGNTNHQPVSMSAVAYASDNRTQQSTTPEQRVTKPADQVEDAAPNLGWTFIPKEQAAGGNEGADGVESPSAGSGLGFKFVESSSPPNNSTIAFVETSTSGQTDPGTSSFTFVPNQEVTVPNYRGGSVTKAVDFVTDASPPAEAKQAKNEPPAHAQPTQHSSLLAGSCAINPGVLDAVSKNTRLPSADRAKSIQRADDLVHGIPHEIARVIQLMTGEHVNWHLTRQPRDSRDDVWPLSGPWTGTMSGGVTIQLAESSDGISATVTGGDSEQVAAYQTELNGCIDEIKSSLGQNN